MADTSRPAKIAVLGTAVAVVLVAGASFASRNLLEPDSDSFPAWFHETKVTPSVGPDILLISVDTLRPDHLSLYGYHRQTSPNIDAWFENQEVYERAYSTEANTTPSMVSLFTGLLPQQHGVRLLFQKISPDVVTVADHLKRAGYQTAAVVSNVVLTGEASGLNTRFDYYDDYVDERESERRTIFERRAERTTNAALQWLTTTRTPGRPHLLWVHYIDPHGPYLPPPQHPIDFEHSGSRPLGKDVERILDYQLQPGISDGLEYVDRYDEEIAYADQEVGRLLDAYQDLGLADDALIIFTSDHGESLMDHERWFTHGYQVYEEIVRIPLMIRRPGGVAQRIRTPVSHADLTPTMLLAAGLEVPETYGQPLPPVHTEPPRDIFVEASGWGPQWRGLVRGDQKWVVRVGRESTRADQWLFWLARVQPFVRAVKGEAFYFDLQNDPGELRAEPWPADRDATPLTLLAEQDPDPGGMPTRMVAGTNLTSPKVAPGVDEAALEKLRSLGYVR